MPIIDDVLAQVPRNWDSVSYSNKSYHEAKVYGEEKNNVLVGFPTDLLEQVTAVHRIQNPFMWGRYVLRKEHLQAKGQTVQETTYYHPIHAADKTKVMEYNLDYRRYTHKSSSQYDEYAKKPYLYTDPKAAKDAYSITSVTLVVVKSSTGYSYTGKITKDWDTDYYPEYFVDF